MLLTALSTFVLASMALSQPIMHPKRALQDDAKERCQNHPFPDNDKFALILYYKESATIGGSGPTLTDNGAYFTFNTDCEQLDEQSWNGGSGTPEPIFYEEKDSDLLEGDGLWLKFELQGALFADDFISEPDNVEAGNDQDGYYRGPELHCEDPYTDSGFGYADAWRICTFVG